MNPKAKSMQCRFCGREAMWQEQFTFDERGRRIVHDCMVLNGTIAQIGKEPRFFTCGREKCNESFIALFKGVRTR